MRFLSFLTLVFPFLAEQAAAADAALCDALDNNATRLDDIDGRLSTVEATIRSFQAEQANGGGQQQPPAPQAPPQGEPSTMAPTPTGWAWVVIPDDAAQQPGEPVGLRCSTFTPVVAVIPAGHVLALLPANTTFPQQS